MGKYLIKKADQIITCDDQDRMLAGADILVDGPRIVAIGENLDGGDAEVIEGKGMFVYPGLINTHHHLLQAFTRNIPAVQNAELFPWLKYLYNVWTYVTPTFEYYASMVGMSDFIKYGGTTMFDQHFAFPRSTSREIIDEEFRVAEELGIRFVAGRSSFTRGEDQGGLPPMELVETTQETLDDCIRLIDKYHDDSEFSMRQVAVAPCSPFSVDNEVMIESARLARDKGVRLHTHLAETLDEEDYCIEVYGKRPFDWAEEVEWTGSDVWYAHGIHFSDDEVRRMAETKTGVAHNPVSNMKLSSGICKVPLMLEVGVPVGLAVDGCGSNDASNLLNDIRVGFLLHRLNSSTKAPTAYDTLKLATRGSAEVLGRPDLGQLAEGKAADLFMINIDQIEYVGATMDPKAILGTVGYARPVELTMINGEVVFRDGRLLNVDEDRLKEEAKAEVDRVYRDL